MRSDFYYGDYRQPRRKNQANEQLAENDSKVVEAQIGTNDNTFVSDDCEVDENDHAWSWPDQQVLMEKLQQNKYQKCETTRASWRALIEHKKNSGTKDWSPGKTVTEFLLVCLHVDVTNGITRDIMQIIIVLLLSLRDEGVINENAELPNCAQTIEELAESFPKTPISLVLFSFVVVNLPLVLLFFLLL